MHSQILIGRRAALATPLALAACAGAPAPAPASSPSRLYGAEMPVPRGRLVQGLPLDVAALRGRVVVVKFFAEYCKPCLRSLPEVARLSARHRGALFIGVALDADEAAVRRQIARFGLRFCIVHDPDHVTAGRFRVTDLPAAFVASADGRIVWVGGPEQKESALALVLARLAG